VSTSAYVVRISAEQAAVEARLVELDGMETIQTGLKNTRIRGEDDMVVDTPPEPPTSRTIEAKRKALSRFVRLLSRVSSHPPTFYSIQPNPGLPKRHIPSGLPQFAGGHRTLTTVSCKRCRAKAAGFGKKATHGNVPRRGIHDSARKGGSYLGFHVRFLLWDTSRC